MRDVPTVWHKWVTSGEPKSRGHTVLTNWHDLKIRRETCETTTAPESLTLLTFRDIRTLKAPGQNNLKLVHVASLSQLAQGKVLAFACLARQLVLVPVKTHPLVAE